MREPQCQFHAGAANRPVRTTKLLVRETFARAKGTTRVKHGINGAIFYLLLLTPEGGREQHEHAEDLEATDQHGRGADPGLRVRELAEVV